jgi:hypothetical protein
VDFTFALCADPWRKEGIMSLARSPTWLLAVGSLVLIACGALVVMRPTAPGPVYAVTAIRAALAGRPQAWMGQTVEIRAVAEPCPWWEEQGRLQYCADQPLMLVGSPTGAPVDPLPVARAALQPLISFLRGLPILGQVLPRPSIVPLLVQARFRVRLQALPCYEALLLDVAPASS